MLSPGFESLWRSGISTMSGRLRVSLYSNTTAEHFATSLSVMSTRPMSGSAQALSSAARTSSSSCTTTPLTPTSRMPASVSTLSLIRKYFMA